MIISDFIEMKNKQLSGTSYCDNRIDSFMKKLDGVSLFVDGSYDIADLEEAWNETKSSNKHEDTILESRPRHRKPL